MLIIFKNSLLMTVLAEIWAGEEKFKLLYDWKQSIRGDWTSEALERYSGFNSVWWERKLNNKKWNQCEVETWVQENLSSEAFLYLFGKRPLGLKWAGNTIRFDKIHLVAFQGMCFILFLDLKDWLLDPGTSGDQSTASCLPLLWSHPCPKQGFNTRC